MEMGFNEKIVYKDKSFDIQTEEHPRRAFITTHIFLKGTIIASKKYNYLEEDKGRLKELMLKQHKELIDELKKGSYDDIIAKVKFPVKNTSK